MKLKVLLVVIACCFSLIVQTKTQCVIIAPLNSVNRPIFFRNYTTETYLVPKQDEFIDMYDNEEIIGHCGTSFKNLRNEYPKITIHCINQRILISDNSYSRYNPTIHIFECTPGQTLETCNILLSPNRAVRPKLFKHIGTRTVQISQEVQSIKMKYGQEIRARCDTKFKSPSHSSPELNLICIKDRIVTLGYPFENSYDNFECESVKWNVYEAETLFPWCPSSMASYILARPWDYNVYEYLAGICYDIKDMSFKSLYYAAKHKFEKYVSPIMLSSFKPLMEISDIDENFISKRTFKYDNPQIANWIEFSSYRIESIVQNSKLNHGIFLQFNKLLNIDWWSALKLGNWKFYEEALASHIESTAIEYDILAGISNAVAAPLRKENCNKNLTMTELVDSSNTKLPLYVWNYLKSPKNYTDEVVVIGVNSPFYDFYDEKDIVFCNDICHQLDWLANTHSTFRYRPLGVIFCCSVDEVIASERLDGFAKHKELIPPPPMPLLNNRFAVPETSTTESVDTTVYDETTDGVNEYDEYGNL